MLVGTYHERKITQKYVNQENARIEEFKEDNLKITEADAGNSTLFTMNRLRAI